MHIEMVNTLIEYPLGRAVVEFAIAEDEVMTAAALELVTLADEVTTAATLEEVVMLADEV